MKRVIVGAGIAAEAYLATLPQSDKSEIMVIGGKRMWSGFAPDKPVGQVPHLNTLPGQTTAPFSMANGRTPEAKANFQTVKDLNNNVGALHKQNEQRGAFVEGKVTEVKRINNQFIITYTDPKTGKSEHVFTDEVVISTGWHPRVLDEKKIDGKLPEGAVLEGSEYISKGAEGKSIILDGGGPTAAWSAVLAIQRQDRSNPNEPKGGVKAWNARSGFNTINLPGEINHMVMEQTADVRTMGIEVDRVRWDKDRQKVEVRYGKNGPKKYCDQFVYTYGNDTDSYLEQLLGASLKNELVPNNADKAKDLDAGQFYQDKTGKLKVIGTHAGKKANWDKLGLPMNAQVPDGIATMVAHARNMNGYVSVKQYEDTTLDCNFNICSRQDLVCLLAAHDVPPKLHDDFVDAVFQARKSKVFGLNPNDVLSAIYLTNEFGKVILPESVDVKGYNQDPTNQLKSITEKDNAQAAEHTKQDKSAAAKANLVEAATAVNAALQNLVEVARTAVTK